MSVVIFLSMAANFCLLSAVAYLWAESRNLRSRKQAETDRLRGSVRQLMRAYEDLDRGFADYRKAASEAAYAQRTNYMEASQN